MESQDEAQDERPAWTEWAFSTVAYVGLAFWPVVFALLWFYAPLSVRILGPIWAALGLVYPNLYLISLALCLPFFGDNPGGAHPLYLLDMGLMGFVVRDLGLRVLGLRRVRPAAVNGWIRAFILVSAVTLAPQIRHFYCEWMVAKTGFFFGIYTHYATAPIFGARAWLDLLLAASLFAALRDEPIASKWKSRFWAALLTALALASLAGLLDYFGLVSLEFWRGVNPDLERFGYRRLQSLFGHSGWFAQYVAALAPAAMALALLGGFGRGAPRWKLGGLILVAILGVTQLLTYQRGGWIAWVGGVGAVLVAYFASLPSARRGRYAGKVALAAVVGAALVTLFALNIEALRSRLGEIANLGDRIQIWKAAWELALLQPWCGIGIGNYFSTHLIVFLDPHPYSFLDKVTAHNTYLHLLAERGIIGSAIFCVILISVLGLLWRAIVLSGASSEVGSCAPRSEALALFGGLTALAAYGLFQFIFYIREIEILFWLFMGLAMQHISAGPGQDRSKSNGATKRWIWIGATALALGIVAYAEKAAWVEIRIDAPDGRSYLPAGERAEIDLPPGATRVLVPVYSSDPGARVSPVSFTFHLKGEMLAEIVFDDNEPTTATLDLPPGRDPAEKLVIQASRTWSPYRYGMTRLAVLDLGVSYLEPVVAEGDD